MVPKLFGFSTPGSARFLSVGPMYRASLQCLWVESDDPDAVRSRVAANTLSETAKSGGLFVSTLINLSKKQNSNTQIRMSMETNSRETV